MTELVTIDNRHRESYVGQGLLGENWGAERNQILDFLEIAYHNVADGRGQNYGIWRKAREDVGDLFTAKFNAVGLESARGFYDHLMKKLTPAGRDSVPTDHIRLVEAFFTDYTEALCEHIAYRHLYDGNNHIYFTGPTGLGKSSCAISLANWIKPIREDELENCVNLDLSELPHKVKGKLPRQTVIQDEVLALAGEGARTIMSMFNNLQDTLRASGVNFFVISPSKVEHATIQMRLEAVAWNPREGFTVFLAWMEDMPLGLVALPWAPDHLWKPYSAFKARNVERSMSGAFRDTGYIARTGMDAFANEKLVRYLT
ncbi:MAG TPA: hypothetical protein VI818_04315, partial [Candidatus Thermoplasmatota archaeon]|nr:hypothetical protein [Candidatus Thermoplasmatota archaeon]